MILCTEIYAILDAATLEKRRLTLPYAASELRDAGVKIVQYRNKLGTPQQILAAARELTGIFAGSDTMLILNDRVDLALLAGWNAVHVGQTDLPPADAKRLLEAGKTAQGSIVGLSTHTEAQVIAADATPADYIAIGPVFGTQTKPDAEPTVGLEGVRRARALTRKPLVAIGGITLENARSVRDAGADSIALISGLLVPGQSPGKVARDFLDILR